MIEEAWKVGRTPACRSGFFFGHYSTIFKSKPWWHASDWTILDLCINWLNYSSSRKLFAGKTKLMIGSSESPATLGVIPCAIAWLYRAINEQKQKTGARFSVRVSAIEITAASQQIKDLLTDYASGEPFLVTPKSSFRFYAGSHALFKMQTAIN